ncbi:MAG TPA: hypothetical protein PLV33_13480 [Opitutaceae bacterium]|nr:hypothetical protein [Opitutaceae bacterium]
MRIRWFHPLLAILAAAAPAAAQDRAVSATDLHGRIEGSSYVSPTGLFRLPVPVFSSLGGRITDTPNVVTFSDAFVTHYTLAVLPLDSVQLRELEARGKKDYLVSFFSNYVLRDFREAIPGSKVDNARFLPGHFNGSLMIYTALPGGSVFGHRTYQFGSVNELPVAKRGNLLFIHSNTLYILSSELAERVIEGVHFTLTVEEENAVLKKRLIDLSNRIVFAPAKTSPASTTEPAP